MLRRICWFLPVSSWTTRIWIDLEPAIDIDWNRHQQKATTNTKTKHLTTDPPPKKKICCNTILDHQLFSLAPSTFQPPIPNSASDPHRLATLHRRFVKVEPSGIYTGICDRFIIKLGSSMFGLVTYSRWKMATWRRGNDGKWLGKYSLHH